MVRVYDCFTFFNETNVLKLRLAELNEVVDFFIIVESCVTHTGHPKDFNFEKFCNEDSFFHTYLPKILYIKLTESPEGAWVRENYQRNCIMHGLSKAQPEDIILISDLDEIPNPGVITQYKENNLEDTFVCQQDFYYYNIESKIESQVWCGTLIARFRNLPNPLQSMRDARETYPKIKNGGWHLSYFGGKDIIRTKIKNFAHCEFDLAQFTDIDKIASRMERGVDPFDRPHYVIKHIDIKENDNLPTNYSFVI